MGLLLGYCWDIAVEPGLCKDVGYWVSMSWSKLDKLSSSVLFLSKAITPLILVFGLADLAGLSEGAVGSDCLKVHSTSCKP